MLNHFWDICPCQPSFFWAIYVLLYIPLDIQPNPDRKLPTSHGFPTCISNQDNLSFFSANSSNFSIPHFLFHETTMKIERHDLMLRCFTAAQPRLFWRDQPLRSPQAAASRGAASCWLLFSWWFKQQQRVVHHENLWEFTIEKYGFQAWKTRGVHCHAIKHGKVNLVLISNEKTTLRPWAKSILLVRSCKVKSPHFDGDNMFKAFWKLSRHDWYSLIGTG